MRSTPRALLLFGLMAAATPTLAQPAGEAAPLAGRVDRIERELRAVQRKVFPGGAQAYLDPEISAQPAPPPPGGDAAGTPVADLQARVQAIEAALAQLTGQVEQDGYRLRQMDEALTRFRSETGDRLRALETTGAPTRGPSDPAPLLPPTRADAPPPPRGSSTRGEAPAVRPDAGPLVAVTPPTGDAAEDAYMAGYNLWVAKRYPQAATALKAVVARYPGSRRASYAQNLLGRAYLDDGKPAAAAEAFLTNYQKMPKGERAPDSLYFLGQSLTQLKKKAEACKVYDELGDVYGATIAEPLKGRVAQGRKDAGCS